jgi:hypothetical protein
MAVCIASSGACAIADGVPQDGRIRIYQADNVAMVGDSLTSGVVNAPWFGQLKLAVDAFYTSRGLTPPTWTNLGSGGTGSVYFKDNVPALVNALPAKKLVWILYGINDINNGSVGPLASHVANMNTGLDAITGSPRLAFCSPWVREEPTYVADIRAMRDAQAAIARARGAAFVDMRAYWDVASTAERTGLLVDALHPSEPAGNAWLSGKGLHQVVLHTETAP